MSRSSYRDWPPDVTSPATSDHWQVLGLVPGADAASLKRAFRAQARRWHPDLNGNDPLAEERFKRVNEAYAVLSDPRRRRTWEAGENWGGEGDAEADPFSNGFPDFEAYLEEVLGTPPARERDDPSAAAEPRVDGPSEDPLPDHDRDFEPEDDSGWDQPGDVTAAPPSPPPVVASDDRESLVELSPEQALSGERVELELLDGTVVEVMTPAMAGDGWRLRLAGVVAGGGDHFLQLRVRTPEGLRVDGLHVHYQLDLHPADAALGCAVVVPTLEGPVRLRVPPGSSSGRLLRLRGRGQQSAGRAGDQLVEIRIVIPDPLSEAEEALFRRLRELDEEREGHEIGGPPAF